MSSLGPMRADSIALRPVVKQEWFPENRQRAEWFPEKRSLAKQLQVVHWEWRKQVHVSTHLNRQRPAKTCPNEWPNESSVSPTPLAEHCFRQSRKDSVALKRMASNLEEEGDAPIHLFVLLALYLSKRYRHVFLSRVLGTSEKGLALFPHYAPPAGTQQLFDSNWLEPLFLLYMSPTADCEVLGLWP